MDQTIVPLLSFVALFLMLANKVESQGIIFDFKSFVPNPTDLTYQGDARVLPGSTVLSLAGVDSSGNPKTASVGRVLYSDPVQIRDSKQATFLLNSRFRITSTNGAAEGIAFFMAPAGTTILDGSEGGNLGIYNGTHTPSIFAVEFDTKMDIGWDPTYRHIGINVESRYSRIVTRFDSGTTGETVSVTITYFPEGTIDVLASFGSQSVELKYDVDLKNILPDQVQFGISSSTGISDEILGLPEILSWSLYVFNKPMSINEEGYV